MKEYLISLDVGTSSMRAVIYSDEGKVLNSFSFEYHTTFPKPSYVEQDPEIWKESALYVLRAAGKYCAEQDILPQAISITSQRASMIPLDKFGKPLHDAIMWQDKRTIDICDRLIKECGLRTLYNKTGVRVNPLFVLNKIIWLRENEPEIFAKTEKFVGVQDYVTFCLTGDYVTDWTQASRTMLMDLQKRTWDSDLLKLAGITEDRLCRLVPPGTVAGTLRPAFAEACVLPAGVPIIVSGGDQQNAALALGVTSPGKAAANTGTGSFFLSYSEKPAFDEKSRVLCQAGAAAGTYIMETTIYNSGAIFRWFKEQHCPDLAEAGDAYVRMTEEASSVPTGSKGVVMLPHFEGSAAPNWNPQAKGLFFNLGLGTTRAMLIRSIMEGIAMELADNLDLMRGLIGDVNTISVAGGLNRSRLFCQMQANTYNARVRRPQNAEASSLGACMNAGVALGWYQDLNMAAVALGGKSDLYMPEEVHIEQYNELRRRRRALYDALNDAGIYKMFMEPL
ncbi:MAG: hypothetical protein K5989_11145 [Lachnospiraceae bacterium]|nr:hypothetical protein [Lachnospiraceae bacterium]